HGDELGLLLAVEFAGRGRLLAFFAVQSQLEAIEDETLAKVFDGLDAAVEGVGDLGIGPGGAIGISFEKGLGTAKILGGTFELLDDLLTDATLFRRQSHDIFLVHGTPPCPYKYSESPKCPTPILTLDGALGWRLRVSGARWAPNLLRGKVRGCARGPLTLG